MSREEVLEALKGGKVDYVRVEFVDVLGNTRGKSLRRFEFEEVLSGKGVDFAESLIVLDYSDQPLFANYYDVIAIPEITTFRLIPYLERTARVLSYLVTPEGYPHNLCVRTSLRNSFTRLEEAELQLDAAFEPTFYLLEDHDGKLLPADGAMAFSPEGLWDEQDFLKTLIKDLEMLDVRVSSINKHYGPGQYELKLAMSNAMEAADNLVAARETIRDVAKMNNLMATFMPKPFSDNVSSSMDVYLSFTKKGNPALVDASDPKGNSISQLGYNILAGLLEHLPAIMAIAAPTINSYRRFKERVTPNRGGVGHERHFVIRLTTSFKENGLVEFRLADPLANPYLFLSSIILSALDGIKRNLEIEIEKDVVDLPNSLEEAVRALNQDKVLVEGLGDALVDAYVKLKKKEIDAYSNYVSDWEVKAYLKMGW